jgi:hypothetical protein
MPQEVQYITRIEATFEREFRWKTNEVKGSAK